MIYPDYHLVVALNTNARLEDFGEFMAIEQAITRLFLGKLIPMRAAAVSR